MLKQFTKYVLQSVAGMIGVSIYILADTFFISVQAGANGLAVLNLILPIYGLMFAIGAMIGIGSATGYSIKKAGGEKTEYYFTQSLIWTAMMSIVFILLGIFAPSKILAILGADTVLITLGTRYLRIAMMAAPLFMCNYTFTSFVRNDHAPAVAMVASISGSIFNIVFDYIFMFPMGMGFTGAAVATAISPVVTMAICALAHYMTDKNHVEFKWKMPMPKYLLSASKLGAPAFVGEITAAVTTITFNTLILSVAGNIGVAAYGVIANVALVVIAIFNGISQGVQPLISQNYGSGKNENVTKLLKLGVETSIGTMILILIVSFVGTDAIINVFNSEGSVELHHYAYSGMRLYFLGFIFASVNIFMVTYFSATNRAKPAIIGSLLRGFLAIVPCAIILAELFGMTGIWLSFLVSEIITFIVISFRKCKISAFIVRRIYG